MPLAETQVRNVKPRAKDFKLSDGGGMYLLVKHSGQRYWRMDYRFKGKRKTLAFGVYPTVTLKAAREKLRLAKLDLDSGKDPSRTKQERKCSQNHKTFQEISRLWWDHAKGTWTPNHAVRVMKRLEDNVFGELGGLTLDEITPLDVIDVIRKVEARGALDVANRVNQAINAIFRFAVQNGWAKHNPASELSGIVKSRRTEHRPALPRAELPQFISELETYDTKGRRLTKLAIKMLLLTFVRSGELRGACWDEFDLKRKIWRIPADRMKMREEHLVPLSAQSIALLKEIKAISGDYRLLFPSERQRNQMMSDNTMRRAIFKMGYDGNSKGKSKAVPHGFRATASSILNESGFNPDAIERQLAHKERNEVRAAYTHQALYLEERRKMMQWWGDYLDDLTRKGRTGQNPA